MKKKIALPVVAGFLVWSALWVGGNAVLWKDASADTTSLAFALVRSVVCSLLAGLVAAKMAGVLKPLALKVLAGLLLVVGIAVQAGVWDQLPVWYHLVFLALLWPMTLFGGKLAKT